MSSKVARLQALTSLGNGTVLSASNVVRLVSLASFIGFWWVASLIYPPSVIPGPMPVAAEMAGILTGGEFLPNFYSTFFRVFVSFAIAMTVATFLGILMGSNKYAEWYFETYVLVGLTIPSLAIAMISLLIFGLGNLAAVIAITVTILPVITENMWEGTKNLDNELVRMGRSFGAGRGKLIREVVLPQLIPYLLAASRFGLSLSWKVTIIVEYLGLGDGVGYQIRQAFSMFSFTGVLAWTLLFAMAMIIIEFVVIKAVERRLTRWRTDVEGGGILAA